MTGIGNRHVVTSIFLICPYHRILTFHTNYFQTHDCCMPYFIGADCRPQYTLKISHGVILCIGSHAVACKSSISSRQSKWNKHQDLHVSIGHVVHFLRLLFIFFIFINGVVLRQQARFVGVVQLGRRQHEEVRVPLLQTRHTYQLIYFNYFSCIITSQFKATLHVHP